MNWGRLLDNGVDTLATDSARTAAVRWFGGAAFAVLIGLNADPRAGGLWFAALAVAELWQWGSARAFLRPCGASSLDRLNYLAALAFASVVWCWMAFLYWGAAGGSLRFISICILTGMLIQAHSFAARSKARLVAFASAPTVALLAFPLLSSDYSAVQLMAAVAYVSFFGLVFVQGVRANMASAAALKQIQADLLEEKQRAVAANNAKSAFLAMMSHELRTPMNGVLGMAHALRTTQLDHRQADHVDMLLRSGDGLLAILNDILDISKIEAGKLELEEADFDLVEVGQRVHDLWTEAASAKGVRLIYDVDPLTPRWLRGDAVRVRQIMLNLISNALKFTNEGEVRLSIRPAGETAELSAIEIAVSDTGLGITEEQQARLFQSFVQAEASTARRFGGTGLGLAICKQLTELMGGTIRLESSAGEGSTFLVVVPFAIGEFQESRSRVVEAAPMSSCRILVVEDNAINQAVARAILEAVGATVCSAGDGLGALEQLRTESFDIVLMDVHMPHMGGVEAVARIRAGEAGRTDIPIIALTADVMAGESSNLRNLGFDAVQPKPIEPAALIADIVALTSGEADLLERLA